MGEVHTEMLEYYRVRAEETNRLRRSRHGRLEFVRTQELLRRHLPNHSVTVADVGGGPGVHAGWLAEDGHRVFLLDPVPEHVDAASRLPGVDAVVGDARELPWAENSVDAVVMLGPLYHLTERGDRLGALREAIRITRPGGIVASAAISRYLPTLELAGLGELTHEAMTGALGLLSTGDHEGDSAGFPQAHFHLAAELEDETREAGLLEVVVYGVEGPMVAALDNASDERASAVFDSAVRCAQALERDEAVINVSSHLLAVGRTSVTSQ